MIFGNGLEGFLECSFDIHIMCVYKMEGLTFSPIKVFLHLVVSNGNCVLFFQPFLLSLLHTWM